MIILQKYNFKKGTLLVYPIKELKKIKNKLLNINKEGKIIDNNEINNYIIGELYIKEDNKSIQIINSYEQYF